MATATEIMAKKVEEFSESIEKNKKEHEIIKTQESFHSLLFSSQETILKTFQLSKQKISFTLDKNNRIRVILEQDNKKIIIPREDIDGIPKECFSDCSKMEAFLSESHLNVSEYLEGKGFKIKVNLKLMGGGNTINADAQLKSLWPNAIVPYIIDETLTLQQQKTIKDAITAWNAASNQTGFKFINLSTVRFPDNNTNFDSELIHYVKFAWKPTMSHACMINANNQPCSVCESSVGRNVKGNPVTWTLSGRQVTWSEQLINCDVGEVSGSGFNQASIMHEIGHVIGLYHEHQRLDRDDFVKIIDTISPDIRDRDFPNDQQWTNNYGPIGSPNGKYDFDSIMHYSINALLTDGRVIGLNPNTIRTGSLHSYTGVSIGNTPQLSQGDKIAAKALADKAISIPQELAIMARNYFNEIVVNFDSAKAKETHRIFDTLLKYFKPSFNQEWRYNMEAWMRRITEMTEMQENQRLRGGYQYRQY